MATISLLSYSLPEGLKIKTNGNSNNNPLSKTFNKITVNNVLIENNGNSLNISNNLMSSGNTIVKKIKDFGMIGSVNLSGSRDSCTSGGLIRKRLQKTLPLCDANRNAANLKGGSNNSQQPPPAKKAKLSAKVGETSMKKVGEGVSQTAAVKVSLPLTVAQSPVGGTPGRKGLPLPQAVARRNARERNRVKQVNNGFAALRERIPEEVAAAFEAQGNGRGSVKKLSKVETLRMAVEYIRNLEKLLGFEFPKGGSSDVAGSFTLIKDEYGPISPSTIDDSYCDDSMSNYDAEEDNIVPTQTLLHQLTQEQEHQPSAPLPTLMDSLPNITTLNGLQYIRIPGTNTYQMITADVFASVHNDQFHALIDSNCISPAATTMEGDTVYNEEEMLATATTPAICINSNNNNNNNIINVSTESSSSVPQSLSSPIALQMPPPSPASHHQQQQQTLSPVSNEILLQTCASNKNNNNIINEQFIQQQQFNPQIKVEQIDNVNVGSTTIIYNTSQHGQVLLSNSSMSMSPPLDGSNGPSANTSTSALQEYFDDHSGSFYEDVATFKKEINDVILDTSAAAPTVMSDESMMDAIDWWDAHTPKSDVGSVIL